VYAVDYNHKRERHLNGCDVEKISRWPDVMILKIFLPKNSAKKLAFLTQNKAKLC
jgi:hypothetical protein